MPTRRTMALIIVTCVAVRPCFAMAKLWGSRTLAESTPGTVRHGAGQIASVMF